MTNTVIRGTRHRQAGCRCRRRSQPRRQRRDRDGPVSPFSESLALLSPHFSCKDQSIVPVHARPARRRCEHLPFALILKMISGTPQRRSADNRRAALAAEPQKNDPRFEHSKMHSVLRCYERPIHCPRHYPAPPSPIPNSSRSRVPGRYRGLTIEAYALDLRQRTSWYRAAPRHLFAVQVRLALPPHAAHGSSIAANQNRIICPAWPSRSR
jgi:hypothetical protein